MLNFENMEWSIIHEILQKILPTIQHPKFKVLYILEWCIEKQQNSNKKIDIIRIGKSVFWKPEKMTLATILWSGQNFRNEIVEYTEMSSIQSSMKEKKRAWFGGDQGKGPTSDFN